MKNRPYRIHRKRQPQKTEDYQSIEEALKKLKKTDYLSKAKEKVKIFLRSSLV